MMYTEDDDADDDYDDDDDADDDDAFCHGMSNTHMPAHHA